MSGELTTYSKSVIAYNLEFEAMICAQDQTIQYNEPTQVDYCFLKWFVKGFELGPANLELSNCF